jgi:hypothetical protein
VSVALVSFCVRTSVLHCFKRVGVIKPLNFKFEVCFRVETAFILHLGGGVPFHNTHILLACGPLTSLS